MSNRLRIRPAVLASLSVVLLGIAAATVVNAAEVKLIYLDDPGEGVYDTTPCAPDCDNAGDTLGEQRRIALQYATEFIGSRLVSTVPIRITVDFRSSYCAAGSALLATAGSTHLISDFEGGRPDTLYPIALANALAGKRLIEDSNDIYARFNAALDRADNCLGGRDWYYGLDRRKPGNDINFVSTAIHEFVHGLGFQSYVIMSPNGEVARFPSTGSRRLPDVFSRHIRDLSMPQPSWTEMTAAERAESATNGPYLVWDGNSTNSMASAILGQGTRQGRIRLYAPETFTRGSSLSHWASAVEPDQLMEPFLTGTPIFNLGLAACALQDMGWRLSFKASGCSVGGRSTVTRSGGDNLDGMGASSGGNTRNSVAGTGDGTTGGNPGNGTSGRAGGGCTFNPDAGFDPVLPFLIALAAGMLVVRRRAGRPT